MSRFFAWNRKNLAVWGIGIGLVALYFGVSFWHLEQFPGIHFDEIGIAEPGYQFFTRGVYGSQLYRGFFNQEKIYLEVMPLMSLLEGAFLRVFGVGVAQMRTVPVLAGGVVLILTFFAGRAWALTLAETDQTTHMSPEGLGLLAMGILLFWQLAPAGVDEFVGSGIPLIDIARIARYDILVPAFGMGAFFCWLSARRTKRIFWDVLSGVLTGGAVLSNVYGVFWFVVLAGLFFLSVPKSRTNKVAFLAYTTAAGLVVGLWGIVILLHWTDFLGQIVKHQGRLDLGDWHFYWDSLRQEIHRYHLGVTRGQTYFRTGFWLFALGLPATVVWAIKRQIAHRVHQEAWLWVPAIVFPLAFALLVNEKRYYYLILEFPVFAILLAWGGYSVYQHAPKMARLALGLVCGLFVIQGMGAMLNLHSLALAQPSPAPFFAELREIIPPHKRILGQQTYWPALYTEDYQALTLLFIISNPERANLLSFEDALRQTAPDFVLVDSIFRTWLTAEQPDGTPFALPFWLYMTEKNASRVGSLTDPQGNLVEIYQLTQTP